MPPHLLDASLRGLRGLNGDAEPISDDLPPPPPPPPLNSSRAIELAASALRHSYAPWASQKQLMVVGKYKEYKNRPRVRRVRRAGERDPDETPFFLGECNGGSESG